MARADHNRLARREKRDRRERHALPGARVRSAGRLRIEQRHDLDLDARITRQARDLNRRARGRRMREIRRVDIAAKSARSSKNTVLFTTRSNDEPPASSTARTFSSTRVVCARASPATISPVAGSIGIWPDANTCLRPNSHRPSAAPYRVRLLHEGRAERSARGAADGASRAFGGAAPQPIHGVAICLRG